MELVFGYHRTMASAPTPEQHLLDTLRADEATVRAAEVRKIRTAIE